MPILTDKIFRRLIAFTALTMVFGIIIATHDLFSLYWIIGLIVEFIFFLWLYNYLKMEIYLAKTEVKL